MRAQEWINLAAGVACISLSACVSNVASDYDREQDFSAYRTFAWVAADPVAASGDTTISPLGKQEMMRAGEAVLAVKGFARTETIDEADFLVGFTVGARDKIDFRTSYDRVLISDGFGSFYYAGLRSVEADEFTEGSLAIDIFDGESRRPVWHGYGSRRLTNAELRGTTARTREGVEAVLEGFPPTLEDE